MLEFSKRFRSGFFRQVPAEPGVFWFLNRRRELLHIESSLNLQASLVYIRLYAGADEMTLLNEVRAIHWTPCGQADLLPELFNQLLLDLGYQRPQPMASHIGLFYTPSPSEWQFEVGTSPSRNYQRVVTLFGQNSARQFLSSLFRLSGFQDGDFSQGLLRPYQHRQCLERGTFPIKSTTQAKNMQMILQGRKLPRQVYTRKDLQNCYQDLFDRDLEFTQKFARKFLFKVQDYLRPQSEKLSDN